MKPYYIYYFDVKKQKTSKLNGHQAYICNAKTEIDALKKWHVYLNGTYADSNFFKNSTYHAECALRL